MTNSMLAAVHDAAAAASPAALTGSTADLSSAGDVVAEAAAANPASAVRDQAAAIVALCVAAGVPAMAEALVKEGVTTEAAKARIDAANVIRAAVASARKICAAIDPKQADAYIAAGASIEHVRADLFVKMEAAQAALPVTVSAHAAVPPQGAAAAGWEKAVAKANRGK